MSIFAKNLVTRADFTNYATKLSADLVQTEIIIANHMNSVNVMPDFVIEAALELRKRQHADLEALEMAWLKAESNFEKGGRVYQTIL